MQFSYEIITEFGYDTLSIRKIAEKIGYSTTVVYSLFPDKLSLVSETIRSTYNLFALRLKESGFFEIKDPIQRMKTGLTAFIKRGMENPHFYMTIFRNYMEQIEVDKEGFFKSNAGMEGFSYLIDAIKEAIKSKMLPEMDPMIASWTVWAASMGVILMLISPGSAMIKDKKNIYPIIWTSS